MDQGIDPQAATNRVLEENHGDTVQDIVVGRTLGRTSGTRQAKQNETD